MKSPLRRCLLLALLLVAAGVRYAYRAVTFDVKTASPSHQFQVYGLRFQGVKPHPLDGCLRVYVDGYTEDHVSGVWQTTLPWGMDLRAEWRGDDQGGFAILKGGQEMITWKIQDSRAVCVCAAAFLSPTTRTNSGKAPAVRCRNPKRRNEETRPSSTIPHTTTP